MTALNGDLGLYRLLEPIGPAGGYGVPWAAVGPDGKRYVVKLIPGFLDPAPDDIARLEVVLARLALVQSDHVVPIVDAGISDQTAGRLPWIAMPEMPGARSLRDELALSGMPTDEAWTRQVLHDIALGLAALHDVGALHRDLKPGNVLIDRDGRAWLIDFELLKVLGVTTRTTRGQEPLGTPAYMAPEQMLGPTLPQSDLWALGLIACELLTGHQPVIEAAAAGLHPERIIACEPLLPTGVDEPWPQLLGALLRKVPAARPASARHVVAWLDGAQAADLQPASRLTRPAPRWSIRSHDDVAGLEQIAGRRVSVAIDCVDASSVARGQTRRLRLATQLLGIDLALVAEPQAAAQLNISLIGDDHASRLADALEVQAQGPTQQVLAPWTSLMAGGAVEVVTETRILLRHRHLVGDRRLICTVEVDARQLTDRSQALPLACGLAALAPDGWRLLVSGLQPGAGPDVVAATIDFARALSSTADCWVHAPGVHRWALASTPDLGVLYRAGRELWTRQTDGRPRRSHERVEVDALAGAIPRDVAERLAAARPDLLACECGAIHVGVLPEPGPATVAHNLAVFAAQDRQLAALAPDDRLPAVIERLARARTLRAALVDVLVWHGELEDLDAVLDALRSPERARNGAVPVMRLA